MKKLLLCLLCISAMADNSNLTTVELLPTSASQIGSYFMYNKPGFNPDPVNNVSSNGASTMSAVIGPITGINYNHLRINNNTGNSLMLVTSNTQIPAPATVNNSRAVYVLPNTNQVWDGLQSFNNLFIAGNPAGLGGGSITSGSVDVMTWGDPWINHH